LTIARYFKYRTLADLEGDSRRRALDIRFSADLSPLFRPVAVGPLRAGNALCIQPMEGCDGDLDGRPGALTFRRYRRFGDGGAKLIWFEAAAVVEEGRANPRQLLVDESTASHWQRLLDDCRQAHRHACGDDDDLVVGLQLTHSGRYSHRQPLPADRSDLVSDDYLRSLVDRYVAAARIAHRCGFQFVDVKQCHGYLLSELLAARTRLGPYGGSLENRTRLARDIFRAIRAAIPELVLASRLNVYDGVPFRKKAGSNDGEPCPRSIPLVNYWGTSAVDPLQPDLAEPIAWIDEMRRLDVALINISMGNPYVSPHIIRPFEYPPPDGYETPEHPLAGVARHFRLAGELQQRFPDLPMVGSGYSYLQEFLFQAGAANVHDGRISFVGVGRAALPQPDFARQLQETGRLDRKRICRSFSYCTALMRSKHNDLGQFATGCPPFDKEIYGPIWDEARSRRLD